MKGEPISIRLCAKALGVFNENVSEESSVAARSICEDINRIFVRIYRVQAVSHIPNFGELRAFPTLVFVVEEYAAKV